MNIYIHRLALGIEFVLTSNELVKSVFAIPHNHLYMFENHVEL